MDFNVIKIDIHTHILPPKLPNWKNQFGYGGFMTVQPCSDCRKFDMVKDDGTFFRRIEENCVEPKIRISECQKHGVQIQVLSTIPTMFHYNVKADDALITSQFLNDHIAEVIQKNPKQFLGLATAPMQSPKLAVKEIERTMKISGMRGVQIGSHINDWNLSDESLFPFYEACESLGACLFVHPWDMRGQEKMQKYWLPWLVGMPMESSLAICSMIFGGIFKRFPKLRVAFAHGGGSFPFTLGRIQHGFEVRPDLCAVDNSDSPKTYIGKFFVDSLVHDKKSLQFLVDLFGKENVCLGTDYPFPLGELSPGKLIDETFTDHSTKEWLNYKSAQMWLGLSDQELKEKYGS